MHKLVSIQENKTHKILYNFAVQTVYLIPARKPELVLSQQEKKYVTQ